MTLEAKDKLISDMVKENPDSTIKDYLLLVEDIEAIESAPKVTIPVRVQGRASNGRFTPYRWLT